MNVVVASFPGPKRRRKGLVSAVLLFGPGNKANVVEAHCHVVNSVSEIFFNLTQHKNWQQEWRTFGFFFLNFCAETKAALPINVFPVPGGPNSKIPFGGPRKPVNMSLYGESKKQ